ncbi:MAG TPA: ATP-binding protein [Ignavibacteriaceae bacterium]|nr:ATP-binding protein [Ignavibacteriaceae bacterium]
MIFFFQTLSDNAPGKNHLNAQPWYFSWWAVILIGVILGFSIYYIDRMMRTRLIRAERKKAKLREAELIKKQAEELETVDNLVKVINRAKNLDDLFNSLLEQTLGLIPQGEKASVLLLNKKENLFRVAFTIGYNKEEFENFYFTPGELKKRYLDKAEEIEKGIYLIKDTTNLFGDDRLPKFKKTKSMLVMSIEIDHITEAYVVFDSFNSGRPFDQAAASLLKRFHEHAVSAISKAQALKTLKEKNEEIIKSQEQLVSQQKLASLGALTAGIAHEIKNPLNFVNNFAEISKELLDELKVEIDNDNYENAMSLIKDIRLNLEKIHQHGKRADSIIKGMLLHSRGSSGDKVLTDINELLEQYVSLAYHGMKAQNKEFNITIEKHYDKTLSKVNIVPQDISRVVLNIINNAYYAMIEKMSNNKNGYVPLLQVKTQNLLDGIEIRIKDNGNGIPIKAKDKLFSPFFTTKPSGEGTGLGLSISYDIITKQHSGEIKYDSEEGKFTEFIITLPK